MRRAQRRRDNRCLHSSTVAPLYDRFTVEKRRWANGRTTVGHHRLNGAQFQRYGKIFLTRTVHVHVGLLLASFPGLFFSRERKWLGHHCSCMCGMYSVKYSISRSGTCKYTMYNVRVYVYNVCIRIIYNFPRRRKAANPSFLVHEYTCTCKSHF